MLHDTRISGMKQEVAAPVTVHPQNNPLAGLRGGENRLGSQEARRLESLEARTLTAQDGTVFAFSAHCSLLTAYFF